MGIMQKQIFWAEHGGRVVKEAMDMCEVYGYVRVSTKEQNEGRQILAMAEKRVPKKNLFVEKQSGKDFERPQYRKMLRKLRCGDLLYIKSNIDRKSTRLNSSH